ncbi:universal stress protein [Methanosarcina sp. MSH10X1]|uniref:universal stress protein n=1 Tax=Methanosarcina sp. MSH10X1 TaxID=2507075 RepID=UPI000FFC05D2|nr:universal stress protein [Methanosarcina sp. MSH10X1]RXA19630.1 universal stress protein [Methanosarcina sp. MSH10X1]
MIERVLVPTDFTIETEDLLGCIGELKNAGLKRVILLHVIDIHKAQGLAPMFERHAKEEIEHYADFATALELEAEALVVVGEVKKVIIEVANQNHVDCIIMGATTEGLIKGRLLGRTTEYITHRSERMLLIEKYNVLREGKEVYGKACRTTFSRILVPLDFSKESIRAVEQLQEFTEILKEIVFVHVIDNIKDFDLLDEQRAETISRLQELGKRFSGVNVRYSIPQGVPSEEITRLAETEDITLIILTARGRGEVKELLLGSTVEKVLRQTIKPVLLIPASRGREGERRKGE